MNIFELVKENVIVVRVAESLGLAIDRHGRALCPFHDDRHPSMKLYEDHFYCFACGAHGDVINLATQITGLKPYEAAKQLAGMHGLQEGISPSPAFQLKKQQRQEAQRFREKEQLCFLILRDYHRLLKDWKIRYPPKTMEEEPDERFVEACHRLDITEYKLDILIDGSEEKRRCLVKELMEENRLKQLQEKICKLKMEVDEDYAEEKIKRDRRESACMGR